LILLFKVVVVFILYNRTSVIMASGRELSYVLLSGILASYAMTFVILGAPSIVNCTRKTFDADCRRISGLPDEKCTK
jgi:hypothetical protein